MIQRGSDQLLATQRIPAPIRARRCRFLAAVICCVGSELGADSLTRAASFFASHPAPLGRLESVDVLPSAGASTSFSDYL